MGATYIRGATKKDIVGKLVETQVGTSGSCQHETIKHCLRGNVLWAVVNVFVNDVFGYSYILCAPLSFYKGYGWGYRDMSEESVPYYFSCPLSYLEMVPAANAAWREKVLAYHASAAARNIPTGDIVEFESAVLFRRGFSSRSFVAVDAKHWLFKAAFSGTLCRLNQSVFASRKFTVHHSS